jgi:uncharacterized UBP type Zn finger protein
MPTVCVQHERVHVEVAMLLDILGVLVSLCSAPPSNGRSSPINPAGVKKAMGAVGSAWQGTGQEDAHEFLTALLEQMQQEVLSAEVRASGARFEN